MLKMMRRNVLVDTGERVNVLGSVLIETPEWYKRINSVGTIVSVGPRCSRLSKADVGSRCMVGIIHSPDNRIKPEEAQRMGLKANWHLICHETKIEAAWRENGESMGKKMTRMLKSVLP